MRENQPRHGIYERNAGDLASKRKPKKACSLYRLLLEAVIMVAITDPPWEDPYVPFFASYQGLS